MTSSKNGIQLVVKVGDAESVAIVFTSIAGHTVGVTTPKDEEIQCSDLSDTVWLIKHFLNRFAKDQLFNAEMLDWCVNNPIDEETD